MEVHGFIDASAMLRGGIYALEYQGKVVYIGKAKSMLVRIYTHRNNARKRAPPWMPPSAKGIVFDNVWVRPCHPDEVDDLEHALINFYRPRYNIQLKQLGNPRLKVPIEIRSGDAVVQLGGPRPPAPILERRF